MEFERPLALLLIIPVIFILVMIIRRNFVKFSRAEMMQYKSSKRLLRVFISLSRIIIVTLLLIAIASPFTPESRVEQGVAELKILVDSSQSFQLFDSGIAQQLASEIGKSFPVTIKNITPGNKSDIGDEILANVYGNDNVLLVSDGQNNDGRALGDVMLFLSSLNTTVNALSIDPITNDVAVSIQGPARTTADLENSYTISIDNIGSNVQYQLKVMLNGRQVFEQQGSGSQVYTYTARLNEGYHELEAQISANDHFADNNAYYKSIKVEPKPHIAFVSQKSSPLTQIVTQLYNAEVLSDIPSNPGKYSAIILNDMRVSNNQVDRLSEYILDGNGLVAIGGQSSFDKGAYSGSRFEGILPVFVGAGKQEGEKDINVVIVIDISGSTGAAFGGSTIEAVEKALAIGIINDLRKSDRVGVVAFNVNSYEVAKLARLEFQPDITDKISRLVFDGGTIIAQGVKGARDMLSGATGSKNIILISDGHSTGTSLGEDVQAARIAALQGIKLYTVGVGEGTDKARLRAMADAGNGVYFEPEQAERIKILFGEPEDDEEEDFSVETINSGHFITSGLSLNAEVLGYNFVLPKANADLVVATAEGQPILSTWKFGLGRIAAVSTDDGSAWSSELLNRQNSQFWTRTINWAVGDLSRNKEFDVSMEDVNLGDELVANVISSSKPAQQNLNFVKVDENKYRASFTPKEIGFVSVLGAVAAVNPPAEVQKIGMNSQLPQFVSLTNGRIFEEQDVEEIVEKVISDSKRIVTDTKSSSWIFIVAAIVLFLLELVGRRILDRRGRRKT